MFANEPMLRVTAPLPVAQLVETRLMNLLHYQTLIASKAARMMLAAPGKTLVDFGFRRAHGAEAGLYAARASYIAGFAGTATVVAERVFGIRSFGTMAHSFVEAHDNEADAFRAFAFARPEGLTLLIDTYDTEEGARTVVRLAPQLKAARHPDRRRCGSTAATSPLLVAEACGRILDGGGLADVAIFASGGLDEYAIEMLAAAGGADRRLRGRHQPRHLGRCAGARLRLQAPGIRRYPAPQALARQGDLAGTQAGVATLRGGRTHGRRRRLDRRRPGRGDAAAGAGDGGRAALRPRADARGEQGVGRGGDRSAARDAAQAWNPRRPIRSGSETGSRRSRTRRTGESRR